MITMVTIDDDVLAVARQRAESRGVPVGVVISELMREGLDTERQPRAFAPYAEAEQPAPLHAAG